MKYRQATTSSEPKIIGVNNGVYQLELNEKKLEKHKGFDLINHLFLESRKRDIEAFNNSVKNLNLDIIFEFKKLKNAKITDVIGFSPFFFSCSYIISQRFVECLNQVEVKQSEFKLFPVSIKNIEEIFYLLFIPMIPHEQINFVNSITYLGRPGLYTGVDYIDVKSIEDYMSQSVLLKFEKVSLSTKFSNLVLGSYISLPDIEIIFVFIRIHFFFFLSN